jgi:transposase InsO family protein
MALLKGGETVVAVCQRFGISRQTAYKFLRRFRSDGPEGLKNRWLKAGQRYAPQAMRWRQRVLRLRERRPTWGARKLRLMLRALGVRGRLPSVRSLQRWLQAAGLVRAPRPQRRRPRPMRRKRGRTARRSNHVWTFDLKGWFRAGDQTKIEPLTVRDLWSRYVLWARPLAPRDERSVRKVCQRLFRRYGRPAVIRCDLGAPFFGDGPHGFTRLSLWWWRLGIRLEFVRRGSIHNNGHEQMHGVMKKELRIARTAPEQARLLEAWRKDYNRCRPHDSLGGRTPASVYRARPETDPLHLPEPTYPQHYLSKRVQTDGRITLANWRGSIGRTFGGLTVGLAPAGIRRYRVYFGSLYLGLLDLSRHDKLILATF